MNSLNHIPRQGWFRLSVSAALVVWGIGAGPAAPFESLAIEQDFGSDDEVREFVEDPDPTNIEFLANLHFDLLLSDIWGYVGDDGREYALVGVQDGTSIIDVTDPRRPVELAFISGLSTRWRDLKTYDHYLYVVSDRASNGLQIIDLSLLPATADLTATYWGFNEAHNLAIDTERGFAYVVGTELDEEGIRILDLSDPRNPVEVGSWERTSVHDIYIDRDIAYAFEGTAGIEVLDVSDPANPVSLSVFQYPALHFAHSGWATPDREFLLVNDERDEIEEGFTTRVLIMKRVGETFTYEPFSEYMGPTDAVDHNVFYNNGLAYLSNYTYGLTVLDLGDPSNPRLRAHYDTYMTSNDRSVAGAWGVYPYLPSGVIIVSDINTGLHVLRIGPKPITQGTPAANLTLLICLACTCALLGVTVTRRIHPNP